jgi:RimJ/RimL family protein N-acetyltransferase
MILPEHCQTERTILSRLERSDSDFFHQIFSDAQLIQFLDNEVHFSMQNSHKLISTYRNQDHAFWLVKLKETEEKIGLAGFYHFDKKHLFAQCKFVIAKQYQRKGYMLEAMKELTKQALINGTLHRIEAQIHINNFGAQAFVQKLGFKCEGRLRENFLVNKVFHDSLLYALIGSDL